MPLFTESTLRPLTITSAPLSASPRAMANPIPPVDAVTSATFPVKSIFIVHSLSFYGSKLKA